MFLSFPPTSSVVHSHIPTGQYGRPVESWTHCLMEDNSSARSQKREGEEQVKAWQPALMCSLEPACAERRDASLGNGNTQLQILSLKKNLPTKTP